VARAFRYIPCAKARFAYAARLRFSRLPRRAGWDEVDVVFVSGDAYVDHPSFAMALLGRVLEAEGFRVAILSQPDWQSSTPSGSSAVRGSASRSAPGTWTR
jgi:hypothetical protein